MPAPLNDLLKATSRSFYLTLRVLPARVRPQIGLAYLLARTTDTIAPGRAQLENLGACAPNCSLETRPQWATAHKSPGTGRRRG